MEYSPLKDAWEAGRAWCETHGVGYQGRRIGLFAAKVNLKGFEPGLQTYAVGGVA